MKTLRNVYQCTSNKHGMNIQHYMLSYIGFGLHTAITSVGGLAFQRLSPIVKKAKGHKFIYSIRAWYRELKICRYL